MQLDKKRNLHLIAMDESKHRPALDYIKISKEKTVVTNGYQMAIIYESCEFEGYVESAIYRKAVSSKGSGILTEDDIVQRVDYPDTDRIEEEARQRMETPIVEVCINAKRLYHLQQAMGADDVVLYIQRDNNKMIPVTDRKNSKVLGLIMPKRV